MLRFRRRHVWTMKRIVGGPTTPALCIVDLGSSELDQDRAFPTSATSARMTNKLTRACSTAMRNGNYSGQWNFGLIMYLEPRPAVPLVVADGRIQCPRDTHYI